MIETSYAAEQTQVYIWNFPLSGDANENVGSWGHGNLKFINGYSLTTCNYTQVRCIDSWQGELAYCIEPDVNQANYDSFTGHGEDFWKNLPRTNPTLTPDQMREMIGRILVYGYHGTVGSGWYSGTPEKADKMAHALATQYLIWEVIIGERDANFDHVSIPSGYNRVLDMMSATHPLRSRTVTWYNSIVDSVKNHCMRPSFTAATSDSAKTVELSWDGSKYVANLTDSSRVLGDYSFASGNSDVTAAISGNVLTIQSAKALSSTATLTGTKKNTTRYATLVWSDGLYGENTGGNAQDIITYGEKIKDPVYAYVKVKTPAMANICITKQDSESGKVLAGVGYRVYNSAGTKVGEGYTDSNGQLTFSELPLGRYTYQEFATIKGYFLDSTVYEITLNSGGQTVSVTRENTPRKGTVSVVKCDAAGGKLAGVAFRLEASNDGGISWSIVEDKTTDANGTVSFEDLNADSIIQYRLTEVHAAAGKMLLAKPIEVGTLPCPCNTTTDGQSYEEIDGNAYLYSVHYTICDGGIPELPFTGSNGFATSAVFAVLMLCMGFFFTTKIKQKEIKK